MGSDPEFGFPTYSSGYYAAQVVHDILISCRERLEKLHNRLCLTVLKCNALANMDKNHGEMTSTVGEISNAVDQPSGPDFYIFEGKVVLLETLMSLDVLENDIQCPRKKHLKTFDRGKSTCNDKVLPREKIEDVLYIIRRECFSNDDGKNIDCLLPYFESTDSNKTLDCDLNLRCDSQLSSISTEENRKTHLEKESEGERNKSKVEPNVASMREVNKPTVLETRSDKNKQLKIENEYLRKKLKSLQIEYRETLAELGQITVKQTAKENKEKDAELFQRTFRSPTPKAKRSVPSTSNSKLTKDGRLGYPKVSSNVPPIDYPNGSSSKDSSQCYKSNTNENAQSRQVNTSVVSQQSVEGAEVLVKRSNHQLGKGKGKIVAKDKDECDFRGTNHESKDQSTAMDETTSNSLEKETTSGGDCINQSNGREGINQSNRKEAINRSNAREGINQSNGGESINQSNGGQGINQSNGGEGINQSNGGESINQSNGGEGINQSNGGESINQSNAREGINQSNGGEGINQSNGGESINQSNGGQGINQSNGGQGINQSNGGERYINQSNGGQGINQSNGGEGINQSSGGESINQSNGGERINQSNGGEGINQSNVRDSINQSSDTEGINQSNSGEGINQSREVDMRSASRDESKDQSSTRRSYENLSFPVEQDDSNGREYISLRNVPPTSVATTLYNNYKLLLLTLAQWLLPDDVLKLTNWASETFSINNSQNAADLLFKLDEKGVVNASDLSKLRDFYESIFRIDLVCIIDAFLLGDYSFLWQTPTPRKREVDANRAATSQRRAMSWYPDLLNTANTSRSSRGPPNPLTTQTFDGAESNSPQTATVQASADGNLAPSRKPGNNNEPQSPVPQLTHKATFPNFPAQPNTTNSTLLARSPNETQYTDRATGFTASPISTAVAADSPIRGERKTNQGWNTQPIGSNGFKHSKFGRPENEQYNVSNPHSPAGSRNQTTDGNQDGNWLCSHYKRRCYVKFECCDKFWPCHRCHNNQSSCGRKKLKSRDTKMLKCVNCNKVQQFGQYCVDCNSKFAKYYCGLCKHLTGTDDHPYHCEKCGICRIHGDRSFHCDICGVCLDVQLRGNHKCREGSAHDECCICLEDAFTGCQILPCSHKVHKDCATQMIRSGITRCPICRESFAHKLERKPPQNQRKRPGK